MTATAAYLLFDERMTLHRPLSNKFRVEEEGEDMIAYERPERIVAIHNRLLELEQRLCRDSPAASYIEPAQYTMKARGDHGSRRFVPLETRFCSRKTIELVHSPEHYERMLRTCMLSERELQDLDKENDLYFCRDTFLASSLACGGVVRCVDAVTESREMGRGPTRAVALVRPPGHHATRDHAMGFCYFNNIAVAAKHAIHTGRAERVFILDWDIHHGNGIQDVTYDDPDIFYLSIHRASFSESGRGWFYPGTGRHDEVGECSGSGANLNIVWGQGGMGNTEYAATFSEVVLPLVSNFRPDLIIVGCGLDAAEGDLLGDGKLSPEMYYIMTKSLLETAGRFVPTVIALEGGYNLEVISTCMEAVALTLLDEPWPGEKPSEGLSSSTLIMMKSGRTKPEPSNQFGLSQYWTKGATKTGDMRKETRVAVSSMKKSAKALANKGTCLGHMHFIAATTKHEAEEPSQQPPCDSSLHRRTYSIKKRRVSSDFGAVATLISFGKETVGTDIAYTA